MVLAGCLDNIAMVMQTFEYALGTRSLNMFYADTQRHQIQNDYLCINLATLLGIGRGYNGETKLLRFTEEMLHTTPVI